MSRRVLLGTLSSAVVLAVTLAACGGGGGGGAIGGPGPNPSPSVAPSASPSVAPSSSPSPTPSSSGAAHPAADGDTFGFSGARTQTIRRFRPTPAPSTQVLNFGVSQNQIVHTGATFHSAAATDFQASEVDTGANQTLTVNSDNYLQVPAANGNLISLGFHSVDSNGAIVDQNLVGSNAILDMIPETASASWNNNAAETLVASDPDGVSVTQTVNATGSYSETITDPVIGNTTATENNDGSGTVNTPSIAFFGMGGTGTNITVGAVSANTITITVTGVGYGSPEPTAVFHLTAWYAATPALATDHFTDMGMGAMPVGCDAATFGASGVHLREVKTRLDTIFGANETETIDTWVVPGVGPACMQTSDSTNMFYDFTGQSFTFTDIFGSTPAQTTTTAETIGLQSETLFAAARHPLSAAHRQSVATALQFAFVQDRLERQRQLRTLRQVRALREFLSKRGPTK